MKVFEDKEFFDQPESEIFGVSWENGETQESFLEKAGFCVAGQSFSGVLMVHISTSNRRLSHPRGGEEFYVYFLDEILCKDFYIPSLVDLIDFCNHIGLNFSGVLSDINKRSRVIHQDDLEEDGSYLSVVPLENEMVFVTSYKDITTKRERAEVLAEWRKKRLAAKQEIKDKP